jgi:hypothetical protein
VLFSKCFRLDLLGLCRDLYYWSLSSMGVGEGSNMLTVEQSFNLCGLYVVIPSWPFYAFSRATFCDGADDIENIHGYSQLLNHYKACS